VAGDHVMEAAWLHYRDSADLPELKDTLIRLAQRWKRYSLT
jgi:hypothetical protein